MMQRSSFLQARHELHPWMLRPESESSSVSMPSSAMAFSACRVINIVFPSILGLPDMPNAFIAKHLPDLLPPNSAVASSSHGAVTAASSPTESDLPAWAGSRESIVSPGGWYHCACSSGCGPGEVAMLSRRSLVLSLLLYVGVAAYVAYQKVVSRRASTKASS